MEGLFRRFVMAVREETTILNSLIKLGEEKHHLIIRNKVKELDMLVQKEGIMISALERSEDARFKLQGELAKRWELPVEQLTLAVFTSRVREMFPEFVGEAEQILEELKQAVKQLQLINKQNRELTSYALEYVDYLWTMLEGDSTGVYSNKGSETEDKSLRSSHKIFDRKV